MKNVISGKIEAGCKLCFFSTSFLREDCESWTEIAPKKGTRTLSRIVSSVLIFRYENTTEIRLRGALFLM